MIATSEPADEGAPDLVCSDARDVIIADMVQYESRPVTVDIGERQQGIAQQPILLSSRRARILEHGIERRMGVPQRPGDHAGDALAGLVPWIWVVGLVGGDHRCMEKPPGATACDQHRQIG